MKKLLLLLVLCAVLLLPATPELEAGPILDSIQCYRDYLDCVDEADEDYEDCLDDVVFNGNWRRNCMREWSDDLLWCFIKWGDCQIGAVL